jgi:hypothetical protein
MDGLNIYNSVYGVYAPDYDAHVYRNVLLDNVNSEPINRGYDDDSIQYGTFTYDNLTLRNCRVGRDPLIQLTCTSPTPGQTGHFRHLTIANSRSRDANVVDLGGGPRNPKLQYGVAYYFHDLPNPGKDMKVVSSAFPALMTDGAYHAIEGFTGKDVRAAEVSPVVFPILLEPVDDLPPVSVITSVSRAGGRVRVRGITTDNGEVATVTVNGHPAQFVFSAAGVVDWEITLTGSDTQRFDARAVDVAGNKE